jgi:hypothetical protein
MNPPNIAWVVPLVIGAQVAPRSLIFYRMARPAESFRLETWRSGEMIILGPVRANCQGWNPRFGVSKTIGTLALLDRRLLFKRPFCPDITISLSEVAQVSDAITSASLKHRFWNYLSLAMRDGAEVVFLVTDRDRWIDAIRIRAAGAEPRSGRSLTLAAPPEDDQVDQGGRG